MHLDRLPVLPVIYRNDKKYDSHNSFFLYYIHKAHIKSNVHNQKQKHCEKSKPTLFKIKAVKNANDSLLRRKLVNSVLFEL